jgi:chromosomal replication initiation ATPase DnaA
MSTSPRQLALDLRLKPAYGREDFLIASSNRLAADFIDRWPDWPSSTALLVGPSGTGKTHLMEIWRRRSGAQVLSIADVSGEMVPSLIQSGGAVAIEHAPDAFINERALFHLLNAARENRGHVLIATRQNPRAWGITLRDLASRLEAAPAIAIQPAEDDLLRGVLVKLFADRQCIVETGLIEYLILRMPRSLEAARVLVAAIDARALALGTRPTRSVSAKVLSELTESAQLDDDGA